MEGARKAGNRQAERGRAYTQSQPRGQEGARGSWNMRHLSVRCLRLCLIIVNTCWYPIRRWFFIFLFFYLPISLQNDCSEWRLCEWKHCDILPSVSTGVICGPFSNQSEGGFTNSVQTRFLCATYNCLSSTALVCLTELLTVYKPVRRLRSFTDSSVLCHHSVQSLGWSEI